MMTAPSIPDRRTRSIVLPLAHLRQAAEDAIGAGDMATEAADRAAALVWTGNKVALINQLNRVAFELAARREALMRLQAVIATGLSAAEDGA